MRGLLKRGSFRLLCLSRRILRLCQRNWNQMATQSGPPVRSAYGAISKDRAISSTSPLCRPQHPPGPTRCRDKCEHGGYVGFTFQAAAAPQSCRLFNPVAAAGRLTPPISCFFRGKLPETFMSEASENKSHCPPSLGCSPSALSLLKSHGINFAVHRKAK